MDQLSNFISEYLKTCETIKKLNSKTIKAYRIDLYEYSGDLGPSAILRFIFQLGLRNAY